MNKSLQAIRVLAASRTDVRVTGSHPARARGRYRPRRTTGRAIRRSHLLSFTDRNIPQASATKRGLPQVQRIRSKGLKERVEKQVTTVSHESPSKQAIIRSSSGAKRLSHEGLGFRFLCRVLEQAAEPRVNLKLVISPEPQKRPPARPPSHPKQLINKHTCTSKETSPSRGTSLLEDSDSGQIWPGGC